jgi:hypothetical protein
LSNIESSKLLAAIGALLLFLTLYSSSRQHYRHNYVAYRHKRYSEHYRDDSIFRYTLNGLILVYWYSSLLRLLQWRPSLAGSPSLQLGDGLLTTSGGIILTIVLILVFTFYILMAKNFRCIFGTLAQRPPRKHVSHCQVPCCSGCNLNDNCRRRLNIGTDCMANSSDRPLLNEIIANTASYSQSTYTLPPPLNAQTTRYCPNCGSHVDTNATFCPHCGRQLITSLPFFFMKKPFSWRFNGRLRHKLYFMYCFIATTEVYECNKKKLLF